MKFSDFQKVVIQNDVESLRSILERDHKGEIVAGTVSPADVLIGKDTDTNVCFVVGQIRHKSSGDTLLHLACKHGSLDVLRFLVQVLDAPIEVSNNNGKRPLHDAAHSSNKKCVEFLLQCNAQVDPIKRADWTPLMLACTRSCVDTVALLLRAGADPKLRNKDGWNSFHIASREGHLLILQCLIESNSNAWDTKSNNLRSPLHTAAFHGHADAVSLLLQVCSYDPDMQDSCGVTPLMDALRGGYIEAASSLIKKSQVDVLKEDKTGRAAIHQLSQAGQVDALEFLVSEANVSVNTVSSMSGQTPLHICAQAGQVEVLEKLVALGANVNAQDFKGRTALHQACGGQHAVCARALLHHGAIIQVDSSGHSPQDYARKPDVIEEMERAMKDSLLSPNRVSESGVT